MKNILKSTLHFLRVNLKTLLLSLVMSVIIWFAVSIQLFPNVYDHIRDIPVVAIPTAVMANENLEISNISVENVNIQIQGKRYIIGSLGNDDFTATLDLSGITAPGTHVVNIDIKPVVNSTDYEIITSGLTASIEVRRIISREIPVSANVGKISIGEGLQIQEGEIVTEPSYVTVKGEETLVNSIDTAIAEAYYDGVMNVTTEVGAELSLYKSDGTKIENAELLYETAGYRVTVPLCKVKTLPLNISLNAAGNSNFNLNSLQYEIHPAEITIAAPATDVSIDYLDKIDIGEINISDLTLRDLQSGAKLTINLPDGYKNLSNIGVAQVYFLNVDSYGKLEFNVPTENFTIMNKDEAYQYDLVTSQLAVTVIGPSDLLQSMSPSNITGTVNMLGMPAEEGVRNVTVSLKLSGGKTKAWVTGEYKVDIRITPAPEETGNQEEGAETTEEDAQ